MKSILRTRITVCALVLGFSGAAWPVMYVWVDESGSKRFSNMPPPWYDKPEMKGPKVRVYDLNETEPNSAANAIQPSSLESGRAPFILAQGVDPRTVKCNPQHPQYKECERQRREALSEIRRQESQQRADESGRKLRETISAPIKGYKPHCPEGLVASGSGCVPKE